MLARCAPRVGRQHRDGAARDPRAHAVGAAGQDDRHARAEHQPGAVGVRQEAELLGQDVAGLEVRRQQDVGIAGDLRVDALDSRRLLADRVVERERAVEQAARDLAAVGHLAERGRVDASPASSKLTVSTAARIATFGFSTPSDIARSIAFWQMSTLSSSVGAMLIAASVTMSTL